MIMQRRTFLSCALVAGGSTQGATSALAQAAAATPLSIVIPFAPGGASDLVVRTLADGLARELGRPVLSQNMGGAGGLIAAAAVVRAGPQGNLLLYGNQGQIVVAPHLFPANGPAPRSALVPLMLTARTQFLLLVPAESLASNALALADAGQLRRLKFGIPGIGSPPHLATVLLAERWGLVVDVIPYQGSAPMLVDLIAGRLDAAFDNVASGLGHVRTGRLRALGVSGSAPAVAAPEVPTLARAGVVGYSYQSWQGLFAPKGIAAEQAAAIVAGVQRTLAEPAVRQRLIDAGLELPAGTAADFEAVIARDADEWEARVHKGLLRPT
jgi:tripartite-type tricarboxylate transporter receptor subunit TctC